MKILHVNFVSETAIRLAACASHESQYTRFLTLETAVESDRRIFDNFPKAAQI